MAHKLHSATTPFSNYFNGLKVFQWELVIDLFSIWWLQIEIVKGEKFNIKLLTANGSKRIRNYFHL